MRILPTITMLATVFAGALASLPLPQGRAGETADSARDLEQEVRRLVGELGGETRNQRAAAEKRLLEIGTAVLPHLPAAELLPSNSVREAVRRIRHDLERRQARESVLPARVTLEGAKSLAATVAEIRRQTGNVLDGRDLPQALLEQPVELQAAMPFWKAVDEISERFKLRYEYDTGLRGLKLLPAVGARPLFAPAVGYAGAFRVEVASAARLQRGAGRAAANFLPAPGDLLRLTLRVRPEPRLRPLFLQFATKEITVRTSGKRDLAPFSPDADYDLSLAEGAGQSSVQLDYIVPEGVDVNQLSLTGRMKCTTAAGNETFRFTVDDEAGNPNRGVVSRRRGGVTVSLNRVLRDKRELRLQIVVAYETGGPAFESHRTWFLHNDVYLEDPAGKRLPLNGGNQTVQQSDGSLGIEYRFIDLPDPLPNYSMVYVAPTLIVDVPIEFEIESVPVVPRPAAIRINR